MSDPLLRYFTQAFQRLIPSRETLVAAGFSNEINDLQNPVKTWGLGLCYKLIH